ITEQPVRQRTSCQSVRLESVESVQQNRQQSVGFARHLHFPRDPARVIHNADARVLDRDIQSSKMVHAALLLLMLGARTTVTPFHHQPEAQHPKFLPINKNAGRLPHLLALSGHRANAARCPVLTQSGVARVTPVEEEGPSVRTRRPVLQSSYACSRRCHTRTPKRSDNSS